MKTNFRRLLNVGLTLLISYSTLNAQDNYMDSLQKGRYLKCQLQRQENLNTDVLVICTSSAMVRNSNLLYTKVLVSPFQNTRIMYLFHSKMEMHLKKPMAVDVI